MTTKRTTCQWMIPNLGVRFLKQGGSWMMTVVVPRVDIFGKAVMGYV